MHACSRGVVVPVQTVGGKHACTHAWGESLDPVQRMGASMHACMYSGRSGTRPTHGRQACMHARMGGVTRSCQAHGECMHACMHGGHSGPGGSQVMAHFEWRPHSMWPHWGPTFWTAHRPAGNPSGTLPPSNCHHCSRPSY